MAEKQRKKPAAKVAKALEDSVAVMAENKAVKPVQPGKIKVEILRPVAGLFLLPYNIGQAVELERAQAEELIQMDYAKKI